MIRQPLVIESKQMQHGRLCFDSENNAIVILIRENPVPIELPLMSKLEAAHRILDEVTKLRRKNTFARTSSTSQSQT